jgi:nitroimidazol reductase NimA-like FMN-containing flavoprotein (pyridoxamine 5'-phosphate oxidase superfamily)
MRYRSVTVFGTAAILDDPDEKRHGLSCIMQHYGGGTFDFSKEELSGVAVIRIQSPEKTLLRGYVAGSPV